MAVERLYLRPLTSEADPGLVDRAALRLSQLPCCSRNSPTVPSPANCMLEGAQSGSRARVSTSKGALTFLLLILYIPLLRQMST